jgi:trans-2,3-dihydro-3-hydroxyanthranilate isomerase
MTRYTVYDVFTDSAFGGNPLAVIPDATALPEHQLQKIAREFNFSETTFVYPPDDPAHTAKVRIFTPTMEVPFAGHPTIGTAIALADLGYGADLVLELGVGPIPCRVDQGAASFVTTVPLEQVCEPSADHVAGCLGLDASQIRTMAHAPVMASVGLPFVIAELADRAALSAAAPATDAFRRAAEIYPSDLDFAVYVYTRAGSEVQARMFAPLDNIPEDPATGSAAAALGAFLAELEGVETLHIRQGEDMGRPSLIEAKITTDGGRVTSVRISGRAVKTMQGELVLPPA